jgi:hypothetical protein
MHAAAAAAAVHIKVFLPFHSRVECSHAADTLTSSSSFRVSFLAPEGGFIS